MPKGKTDCQLDALEMAKAILGGWCVVGASFRGNEGVSGLNKGGQPVLSTGRAGEDGTPWTSYIDIDFVAEANALRLDFCLETEAIPTDAPDRVLSDGVSVWANGAPVLNGAPPVDQAPKLRAPAMPVAETAGGLRFGLSSIVRLARGQVNSLRIATGALGAAGILSTLTVTSAEAAPGGEPGNPNNDNNGNASTVGNANNAHSQAGGNGNGVGGSNGGGGTVTDPALVEEVDTTDSKTAANNDTVEVVQNSSTTVDLVANDVAPGQSVIFITEINGQAVEPGDTVTLSTGETITINADGTVTITADGDPTSFTFEYTAAYGTGNANQSDTATVTVNTVPCFVAGTMIRTDRGDIPVERLKVGQLVRTRDDGYQPIRWIGQRTLPAEGKMAPVRIARDTFGQHGAVMVSPLHRILVQNEHAELLFGTSEVLAAARDLIDDKRVRQIEGGQVHYVHLLFDRHQVVWSEGLQSESFLPGPQTTHCFEAETIAEICEIFPEIDPLTGAGYGPSVRPALKRFEARLLVA